MTTQANDPIDVRDIRAIWLNSKDEVAAFAAADLARILGVLGCGSVSVQTAQPAAGPWIRLAISRAAAGGRRLPPQAYRVERGPGAFTVLGGDARGVLYGTYALLEAFGVRFVMPGDRGIVWRPDADRLRVRWPLTGRPRFEARGLIAWPLPDVPEEDRLDFLARLRFNRYHRDLDPAGQPEAFVAAVQAARRRGIELEVGGHWLDVNLLPRSDFEAHPDWFRQPEPTGVKGRRSADYNACATSPGARRRIEQTAEAAARCHPGVNWFHVWGADISGGGWCQCPGCKPFTPSDQALLCVNAAARGFRRANPAARVIHIGYHDTLDAARRVQPEPNVVFTAAPRQRCYRHGLGDPACARNVRHAAACRDQAALFRGRANQVFEYYLDGILNRNMLPPLLRVIAADLSAYQRLGYATVDNLTVNTRRTSPAELLNVIAFGRMAYDAGATPAAIRRDYAAAVFGSQAARYVRALERWERALGRALAMCGYGFELAHDFLWLMGESRGFARKHARELAAARREFASVPGAFASFPVGDLSPLAREMVADLAAIAGLARIELEILHRQVRGQNERMAWFAGGGRVRLAAAAKELRAAAALCRREAARAEASPLTATAAYTSIQTFLADELEFLAGRCDEERGPGPTPSLKGEQA